MLNCDGVPRCPLLNFKRPSDVSETFVSKAFVPPAELMPMMFSAVFTAVWIAVIKSLTSLPAVIVKKPLNAVEPFANLPEKLNTPLVTRDTLLTVKSPDVNTSVVVATAPVSNNCAVVTAISVCKAIPVLNVVSEPVLI